MKIEYVRSMQNGYMRMIVQDPLDELAEEMFRHNVLEGILPMQWQRENDKYVLRYDITGKQALDELLENTKAEEQLLKCLLVGIGVAIRQLEKYLLPQEGLLLSPEAIFWDYKTETMHFCYCPEHTQTLREQFANLLEYLLAKTNHKNVLAVQLIYGVYEEAIKPAFHIKELEQYLHVLPMETKAVNDDVYENKVVEQNLELPPKRRFALPAWDICKVERIKDIMAWIRGGIKKKAKKEQKSDAVLYRELEEVVQEDATIILGREMEEIRGYLKYEGTNYLPDISIAKTPFVIGTAESCDGIIRHPNISHCHAKITYQDNTYFIEDLNSTNGTRVNGGLLSYKTRVSLKKNESIYFANEPYRFL